MREFVQLQVTKVQVKVTFNCARYAMTSMNGFVFGMTTSALWGRTILQL